jgi:hypothetical protein
VRWQVHFELVLKTSVESPVRDVKWIVCYIGISLAGVGEEVLKFRSEERLQTSEGTLGTYHLEDCKRSDSPKRSKKELVL